jgi:hypothetical protein
MPGGIENLQINRKNKILVFTLSLKRTITSLFNNKREVTQNSKT